MTTKETYSQQRFKKKPPDKISEGFLQVRLLNDLILSIYLFIKV